MNPEVRSLKLGSLILRGHRRRKLPTTPPFFAAHESKLFRRGALNRMQVVPLTVGFSFQMNDTGKTVLTCSAAAPFFRRSKDQPSRHYARRVQNQLGGERAAFDPSCSARPLNLRIDSTVSTTLFSSSVYSSPNTSFDRELSNSQ